MIATRERLAYLRALSAGHRVAAIDAHARAEHAADRGDGRECARLCDLSTRHDDRADEIDADIATIEMLLGARLESAEAVS
jgi:hypothetical protein